MIHWSLTLTGNQVAVLKALKNREFGKPWESGGQISHWITGVRALLKEGLIEHRETKQANGLYNDQTRSGQFLTPRGRFILQMIEEDLEKFLSADVPKRKRSAKSEPKAA